MEMTELEKVIKEWEAVLSRDPLDAPWDLIDETLALLKEQQQQIWEFQDQVEYFTDKQKEQKFFVDESGKITPLPVVVRCKDCKNWTVGDIGTYCPYHHDARPDWFCADGERRGSGNDN